MAQKIQTLFIDDIDGGEAEGTVRFGLDGSEYEIDLSAQHNEELRATLATYVAHARKTGGTARRATARGGRKSSAIDNVAVRSWARDNGYDIKERGRVPADLVAKYREATGQLWPWRPSALLGCHAVLTLATAPNATKLFAPVQLAIVSSSEFLLAIDSRHGFPKCCVRLLRRFQEPHDRIRRELAGPDGLVDTDGPHDVGLVFALPDRIREHIVPALLQEPASKDVEQPHRHCDDHYDGGLPRREARDASHTRP
jgi:hypothetical protein